MNTGDHSRRAAEILAQLDGNLPGGEADSLRPVHAALGAAGDAAAQRAPAVDLAAGVRARIAALRSNGTATGNHPWDDGPLALAYLEQALSPADRLAFEQRLAREPWLEEQLQQLAEQERALFAVGAAHTAGMPTTKLEIALPALDSLEADLEALGDAWIAQVPAVQLVGPVMRRVGEQRATATPAATVVRFSDRRRHTGRRRGQLGMLLAAALLALLSGWAVLQGTVYAPAVQDPEQSANAAPPSSTAQEKLAQVKAPTMPELLPPGPRQQPRENAAPAGGEIEAARRKSLTVDDVMKARRAAVLREAGAAAGLQQLGSLTPEQARELLAQDLSAEARLGLLRFLPPDEAAAELRAMIAANPDDPYLRYALARALGTAPDARDQLGAWNAQDPANALPYYLDARMHLEAGNPQAALALLEQAGQLDRAYAFSVLDARMREQALIAAGTDPAAAAAIAATTGGAGEYQDLTRLANALLEQGNYYAALGDSATAEAIFNAIHQLGVQFDQGAAYGNERMAALETQRNALLALEQLLGPANQDMLLASFDLLSQGFGELDTFFTDLNTLFESSDTATITTIAELILLGGDLSLFEVLR